MVMLQTMNDAQLLNILRQVNESPVEMWHDAIITVADPTGIDKIRDIGPFQVVKLMPNGCLVALHKSGTMTSYSPACWLVVAPEVRPADV